MPDIPLDRRQQRGLALQLIGNMVRFAHQPDGPEYLCTVMAPDGMVEILGLSGLFAPHLFVLVRKLEVRG